MNSDSVTRTQSNISDLFQELNASSHCLEDVQHEAKERMFLAREIPIYIYIYAAAVYLHRGGTQSEVS